MRNHIILAVLLMTLLMTLIPSRVHAETTYVAMVGRVDSFGTSPAIGWLKAVAKVGEWAKVHAFWMPPFKIPEMVPSRNFTFAFYAAKLVNTSLVALDYSGYDLYTSGLWDVFNVTWVYNDGNFTRTISVMINDGSGELYVENGWTTFALDINGIDRVAGHVSFYLIASIEVPKGDINCDRIVDIFDVVNTAMAFGHTPGMGSYYFDKDINFDFIVDIYDLVAIAVDFGKTY